MKLKKEKKIYQKIKKLIFLNKLQKHFLDTTKLLRQAKKRAVKTAPF